MSKLKPPSAAKKKAAACRKLLRTVVKAKREEADVNRRTKKRPSRDDAPCDGPSEVSAKAGVRPQPRPSQAWPTAAAPVRRASGKRTRRRFDPNSWSASPVVRRTNVLCLGVSYPCVRSQMRAENANGDILHYNTEESVEQAVELVRRNILTEMDGRDLARCLAIEAANDTLAYCVSMESGAKYGPRHLHANFNRRSFVQEMKKRWGANVKFRQVILDYFWIPRGSWTISHWARSFFNMTLPSIVTEGLLDFSSGESSEASTAGLGGGVVYLPFCLHCVKETIAAIGTLSKYYAISFLYKSELKEHALWCATNSIEPEVMQSWFGKAINQEDVYCTFSPYEVHSSADDAHLTKDKVLEILRGIEDFRDVRMIKLQALKKFDPDFKGGLSEGILGVDKGGFVGLKKAHDVERGFDKLSQRKKAAADKTAAKTAGSDSVKENGLRLRVQKVTRTPKQTKVASVARKSKAPAGNKKLSAKRSLAPREGKEKKSRKKLEDLTTVKGDSGTSSEVINAEFAPDLRVSDNTGIGREAWGIEDAKFPLEIETLWNPHAESKAVETITKEKTETPIDSESACGMRKRLVVPSCSSFAAGSSATSPVMPERNESRHFDSAHNSSDNTRLDRKAQCNSDSTVCVVTPSPRALEGADLKSKSDVAVAEHPPGVYTSDEQHRMAPRKQGAKVNRQPAHVCSLQSLNSFSPNHESRQLQEMPATKLRHRPNPNRTGRQRDHRSGGAHVDTDCKASATMLCRTSCGTSVPKLDSWRRESKSLNNTGKRIKVNLLGATSSNSLPLQEKRKSAYRAQERRQSMGAQYRDGGQDHQDRIWKKIEQRFVSTKHGGEEETLPSPLQMWQPCACGGDCEGASFTGMDESTESAMLLRNVVANMHSSTAAAPTASILDESRGVVRAKLFPLPTVADIHPSALNADIDRGAPTGGVAAIAGSLVELSERAAMAASNVHQAPLDGAVVSSTKKPAAIDKNFWDDKHFDSLMSELCSHRDKTGSLRVRRSDNRQLYNFVKCTRKDYSKYREGQDCRLTEERAEELREISFWEGTMPPKSGGRKKRKKTTPVSIGEHSSTDNGWIIGKNAAPEKPPIAARKRRPPSKVKSAKKARKLYHGRIRKVADTAETRQQNTVIAKSSDRSFAPAVHFPPSTSANNGIAYISFGAGYRGRTRGLPKKRSQILSPYGSLGEIGNGQRHLHQQSYSASTGAIEGVPAIPRRLGVGVDIRNDTLPPGHHYMYHPPPCHQYHQPLNHQYHPSYQQGESGSMLEVAALTSTLGMLCNAAASPILARQSLPPCWP